MSNSQPDSIIRVEFKTQPGRQEVSLGDIPKQKLAELSELAGTRAMETIQQMAQRTVNTVNTLSDPPHQVQITFGINFDMESGAIIAKASGEASVTVKLTWNRPDRSDGQG